jgi:hypothetical protein
VLPIIHVTSFESAGDCFVAVGNGYRKPSFKNNTPSSIASISSILSVNSTTIPPSRPPALKGFRKPGTLKSFQAHFLN